MRGSDPLDLVDQPRFVTPARADHGRATCMFVLLDGAFNFICGRCPFASRRSLPADPGRMPPPALLVEDYFTTQGFRPRMGAWNDWGPRRPSMRGLGVLLQRWGNKIARAGSLWQRRPGTWRPSGPSGLFCCTERRAPAASGGCSARSTERDFAGSGPPERRTARPVAEISPRARPPIRVEVVHKGQRPGRLGLAPNALLRKSRRPRLGRAGPAILAPGSSIA